MTRYAVVGMGAVGGLYGARLAAAGHELHVLARSDTEPLRDRGFRLESVDGDVVLPPGSFTVATDPAAVPPVDVALVALKTTANDALPSLLGPLRAGAVVMLQNGLGVEDSAAAAVGDGTSVLGGLCFVCSVKEGPAHVRHVDYGYVTLGEWTPDGRAAGVTATMAQVAGDLAAAGVEVTNEPDLVTARWKKLVWNIPYNGLSVVLDAGTDELMANDDTRALVRDLMDEVVDGAAACGRAVDRAFVDTMLDQTDHMVPYRTSMKTDYDTGRPMELDAIYAAPVKAARAAGGTLPRIEMLWRQLQLLDARNTARK